MSYRSGRFGVWWLSIAALVPACGGLSYQVDRDLLREVSVENKLLLFEAENEVSIAYDEQEQIQRQIRDVRTQIVEVQALDAAAERDGDRAAEKKDDKTERLAAASRDVLALKRSYLAARVDVLRTKLAAQDDLLRVALAKYELAKAKLVKKNNVKGAADLELPDFEKQVDECVEVAKGSQATVAEYEKSAEARHKDWIAARGQLEHSSGGGAASPWADDASVWGAQ